LAPGQTLVGIDEETALVRRDGGWRVEGRRDVWVVAAGGGRTPYPAGASLPADLAPAPSSDASTPLPDPL
jgi:hypothetical protein